MFAVLRTHITFKKFGCRTIRRFRVLDGDVDSLPGFNKSKLLEQAQKLENQVQEKLSQVLNGKLCICFKSMSAYRL